MEFTKLYMGFGIGLIETLGGLPRLLDIFLMLSFFVVCTTTSSTC